MYRSRLVLANRNTKRAIQVIKNFLIDIRKVKETYDCNDFLFKCYQLNMITIKLTNEIPYILFIINLRHPVCVISHIPPPFGRVTFQVLGGHAQLVPTYLF